MDAVIEGILKAKDIPVFFGAALEIRNAYDNWKAYIQNPSLNETFEKQTFSQSQSHKPAVLAFILWLADHCGIFHLNPDKPFFEEPAETYRPYQEFAGPSVSYMTDEIYNTWIRLNKPKIAGINSNHIAATMRLLKEVEKLSTVERVTKLKTNHGIITTSKMLSAGCKEFSVPFVVHSDKCIFKTDKFLGDACVAMSLEKDNEQPLIIQLEQLSPLLSLKVAEHYRKVTITQVDQMEKPENEHAAKLCEALKQYDEVGYPEVIAHMALRKFVKEHEIELKKFPIFRDYPFHKALTDSINTIKKPMYIVEYAFQDIDNIDSDTANYDFGSDTDHDDFNDCQDDDI